MQGMKRLDLASLNNGAASELFERELNEVLNNIDDPSTNPKEPRKITLEFTFTPSEAREMGVLEIRAKSKLAPAQATGSTFILQDNGNGLVPWEPDHHQPEMFASNVSKIDRKSAAAGEREE